METNKIGQRLNPSLPGDQLIRRLCSLQRDEVEAVVTEVAALTKHRFAEVRAEALSTLFVVGRIENKREIAVDALAHESDDGVRAKAPYALAAISNDETRSDDVRVLVTALRDVTMAPDVRRAAYEALMLIFRRPDFPDPLEEFESDFDVDWEWIAELEILYAD